MLSAVSPDKMPLILQNLKKVLKVAIGLYCWDMFFHFLHILSYTIVTCSGFILNLQPHGFVLVRDYAIGDFAQVSIIVPIPYFLLQPYLSLSFMNKHLALHYPVLYNSLFVLGNLYWTNFMAVIHYIIHWMIDIVYIYTHKHIYI